MVDAATSLLNTFANLLKGSDKLLKASADQIKGLSIQIIPLVGLEEGSGNLFLPFNRLFDSLTCLQNDPANLFFDAATLFDDATSLQNASATC